MADSSSKTELFPRWHRWSMRVVLVGFVFLAAAAAMVAWFGSPSSADTVFDIALWLVGGGVALGFIGIIASGRWR